jgi:hypothetical protein
MKIAFRLIFIAVAAGLASWLWTVVFPGPEKQVLRQVARLAATANISAGDGNLTRAGKAGNLAGAFAIEAEIVYDVPGVGARTLDGRDEIREAALGAFANLPALKVVFTDATARIGPDQQSGEVTCTARVSAGDSKDFGIQELRFQLKKSGGHWLITRAETVKTLQ